jgi:TonB family protein
VRIESPQKELSVGMPAAGYLVDNHDGEFQIIYENKDRSVSVNMVKMAQAQENFRSWSRVYEAKDKRYRVFKSGEFLERFLESRSETSDWHTFWVQVASPRWIYHVNIRTREADNDIAMRFLRSIRLGGKQIFDAAVANPPESQTLAIESLKTSDIILKAIAQPDPIGLVMESDLTGTDKPNTAERPYSRHVIVVRKPKAVYTDRARRKNVNGTVKLKVVLLANGTIGSIVILKSLDKDLDQKAFEAACKIKFIPPEIDDKPVDVTLYFDYGFETIEHIIGW